MSKLASTALDHHLPLVSISTYPFLQDFELNGNISFLGTCSHYHSQVERRMLRPSSDWQVSIQHFRRKVQIQLHLSTCRLLDLFTCERRHKYEIKRWWITLKSLLQVMHTLQPEHVAPSIVVGVLVCFVRCIDAGRDVCRIRGREWRSSIGSQLWGYYHSMLARQW